MQGSTGANVGAIYTLLARHKAQSLSMFVSCAAKGQAAAVSTEGTASLAVATRPRAQASCFAMMQCAQTSRHQAIMTFLPLRDYAKAGIICLQGLSVVIGWPDGEFQTYLSYFSIVNISFKLKVQASAHLGGYYELEGVKEAGVAVDEGLRTLVYIAAAHSFIQLLHKPSCERACSRHKSAPSEYAV